LLPSPFEQSLIISMIKRQFGELSGAMTMTAGKNELKWEKVLKKRISTTISLENQKISAWRNPEYSNISHEQISRF
jgi:hypothetical protein